MWALRNSCSAVWRLVRPWPAMRATWSSWGLPEHLDQPGSLDRFQRRRAGAERLAGDQHRGQLAGGLGRGDQQPRLGGVGSYEPLGTVGFLLLGAGPGFAGLYFVAVQSRPPEPAWDRVRRLAGIPAPDPERERDLTEDDLGTLPSPSIWPIALALGLTVAATGLVFGFWPLLLGGGVVILAAARWQAAVNREVRWGTCGGRPGRRRPQG